MIQRLAIVGVGLLGGSVAKAARAQGLARQIVGIGRDAARLRPALEDGCLDEATAGLGQGLLGADFVVLAAPVQTIEDLLPPVSEAVGGETLVTDVGSTKGGIVQTAERLARGRSFQFVGSHPMTGSEQAGYAAARADLFHGATVIVTPTDQTDVRALKGVTAFWEALGTERVRVLDPVTHDRLVAAISHLPHLVAYALVAAVMRVEPGALEFAARGFRDTTRLAGSDPRVWREIFLANRAALSGSLAAFREALRELETLIDTGDVAALEGLLGRIKAQAEELR